MYTALANNIPASAAATNEHRVSDATGQIAPPGMKPRVTATLWEDEGSLCFQVEASGVCVARREDNHMINGTKLLNVAGMTRGRRDGILKSEKTRHVVKIGPMHLKGVWIPFDRALDFANKEKITERLYPLFVHNIGALLYHPQNSARQSISGPTIAAHERRQSGQLDYNRGPQSSQPPSLQHHHSMANPVGAHDQPAPHSIVPHPASGRPGLDRAHTFPTPPTNGSSSMMGMGNAGSSYEWGGAPVSTGPVTQPLSIDTTLSNARSVPTTPASTPPANNMQGMSAYQTSGPYDGPRPMYTHSAQSSYGSQYAMAPRYGQAPGVKNEMGPPPRAGHESDDKRDIYGHGQEHPASSDAGEGEHEGDYTHAAGPYGQNRASYGYPHTTPTSMSSHEQSHVSPEMNGSPTKAPGRSTPRTAGSYGAYNTQQRAQNLPSSNLYNVMSDNRGAPNGADMYNGSYAPQSFGGQNGLPASNKRGFEMDDDESSGLKRQKTQDRKAPAMMTQNKR